jgi:murein DD-endopeptidase MepM/ murein hydrolase activator NlpD
MNRSTPDTGDARALLRTTLLRVLLVPILLLPIGPSPQPLAAQYDGPASDYVEVYAHRNEDNSYDFFARNDHFVPVYISVDFDRLVSLEPSQNLPWRGVITPGAEDQSLFSLRPTATRGRIGYNLRYTVAMGDPDAAEHDDDYLYLFPFEHGTKRRITQGHDGSFSHFGENRYAIDFDMPEGTAVHAARGGTVVRVKQDCRAGGPSMAYSSHGNVIMVAHDDGTFGNYVHLRYRGSRVSVGDQVEAGDLIGYSGNTGVSSGPHLHFDVRVPRWDGTMQSIPFLFRGTDGEALDPREGLFYYAAHPGLPEFEMVFGEDLTNEDFADHRREIAITNRIEFRTEEYDLTYAVFVGNGLHDDITATIGFNLVNMSADARLPLEVTIPAGEEIFVTLLRADPAGSRWQYAPTVRYRRAP